MMTGRPWRHSLDLVVLLLLLGIWLLPFHTVLGFSSSSGPIFSLRRRSTENRRHQCEERHSLAKLNGVRDVVRLGDNKKKAKQVSICVIGGGVSGLTAAITAANNNNNNNSFDDDILVLEASPSFGGRVQSDYTKDGYVLDRGFAVFLTAYPQSQQLLDYNALELKEFIPGAIIIDEDNEQLRIVDPLRRPMELLNTLTTPVASLSDKIRMVPLLLSVLLKSIQQLFEHEETDTLTCLQKRYCFSDGLIQQFFAPFLEGIFLSPLQEQSSCMFHFVLKMFAQGDAALPARGMGAVSQQLVDKATSLGVDFHTNVAVTKVVADENGLVVKSDGLPDIHAQSVVLATEGPAARRILQDLAGFESIQQQQQDLQPQRSVGCLYYAFKGKAPVQDPILILSGMGEKRGSFQYPINNVCFPSLVHKGYAPEGCNLCSVAILQSTMELYASKHEELDTQVRRQLADWFPEYADEILQEWERKGIYDIKNAQPGQLPGVPFGANVNGGRDCSFYRGKQLPEGLFVCGDHVATASLNGALESGVNAGNVAAKFVIQQSQQ